MEDEQAPVLPEGLGSKIDRIGNSYPTEHLVLTELALDNKEMNLSAIEVDDRIVGYGLEIEGKCKKGPRKYAMLGTDFVGQEGVRKEGNSLFDVLMGLYGTVEQLPDFVQLVGEEPTADNAKIMLKLASDPRMTDLSMRLARMGRFLIVTSWAGDGTVIKHVYGRFDQFELDAHADLGYRTKYKTLNTRHSGDPEDPNSGFVVEELVDLTGIAVNGFTPDMIGYSTARRNDEGELVPGKFVRKNILLPEGMDTGLVIPQYGCLSRMYGFKLGIIRALRGRTPEERNEERNDYYNKVLDAAEARLNEVLEDEAEAEARLKEVLDEAEAEARLKGLSSQQ